MDDLTNINQPAQDKSDNVNRSPVIKALLNHFDKYGNLFPNKDEVYHSSGRSSNINECKCGACLEYNDKGSK